MFFTIGKFDLFIHDLGWHIAWDRIIKFQCRWPTYKTFRSSHDR